MPQNELVEGLGLDEYQYGFIDDEAHVYRTQPGLDEGVVRQISKHKEEPEWMLEFRLKALKIVASGVNTLREENPEMTVLLITHYQRLLNYITPDMVHVMVGGRIVRSGGPEVAIALEEQGYADWKDQEGEGVEETQEPGQGQEEEEQEEVVTA